MQYIDKSNLSFLELMNKMLKKGVTVDIFPNDAILLWWFFLFYVLVFKNFFVLLAPYGCFQIFN